MKRSTNHMGVESFSFENDNKLKIFPSNSFKFKPKDHIIINEVQECILDNFWYQYNNKKEESGYMLSILNIIAEYFHMMNEALPKYDDHDSIEQKHIYVIFKDSKPGVYTSFEEIRHNVGAKYTGGISRKKYINIDESLTQAQRILKVNYHMKHSEVQNVQKKEVQMSKNKKLTSSLSILDIKKEVVLNKPTYKECLMKGFDPLDGEYIDCKLDKKN
jgi:predicted secreted acid phosphatase